MENEELQPAPVSEPQDEVSNLRSQLDSLHHTVVSVMLLLIVISGTFWIYLLRQARTAKNDLEYMIKPSWTNVMVQFQRNGPIIDETVKKLQEFGRTNADFAPVLAKYGLKPGAPATGLGGTAVPPAKPAKK